MMFTGGLSGCQVLLIRPEQSSKDLQQLLCSAGAKVFHYPVMKILHRDITTLREQIPSPGDINKVIFVSRNAVMAANAWIEQNKQVLDLSVEYFAVGSATADLLSKKGIAAITPSHNMTSEGLLGLPELQIISGENIVIFSGHGGRTLLQDKLTMRGAKVFDCEVYERAFERSYAAEINGFIDSEGSAAILLHSVETITALLNIVEPARLQKLFIIPVIVPGLRLQQHAKNVGFKIITTATNAMPESMVSATHEWYSSRNGIG